MTKLDAALATRFIQARNCRAVSSRNFELLVIHSMEAAESSLTALHVAQWFASPKAPMASAHYCLDGGKGADPIVQCVAEASIAFAAPGANAQGIHLELAGYAKQTEAQWLADSLLLQRAAYLAADICKRRSIPVSFIDAAGLLRGERGITTHAEVSKAWKKSNHTDPGSHWPMTRFLEMVRSASSPTLSPCGTMPVA